MAGMLASLDSDTQRKNWSRFEAGANAALDLVRSYGPGRHVATLALIGLLLADLGVQDVGQQRH